MKQFFKNTTLVLGRIALPAGTRVFTATYQVKADQGLSAARVSKARKTYSENSITEERKESILRAIVHNVFCSADVVMIQ